MNTFYFPPVLDWKECHETEEQHFADIEEKTEITIDEYLEGAMCL